MKATFKVKIRDVKSGMDYYSQSLEITDENAAPFGVYEWASIQYSVIRDYWKEIGVEKVLEINGIKNCMFFGKKGSRIYLVKIFAHD